VEFIFRIKHVLLLSFFIGTGIPILIYAPSDVGLMMLLVGFFITTVFVAIAFLSSILTRDKAKGIGIAIMLWLFFALLFDGLVLFVIISIC
jgi:Cu-processing system permease protein